MQLTALEDLQGAGDVEALHAVEEDDQDCAHVSILRSAGEGRNDEYPTFSAIGRGRDTARRARARGTCPARRTNQSVTCGA
ncbi:hypothetical protein GCM10027075_15140 [Streptomyces heilongjiangensis]